MRFARRSFPWCLLFFLFVSQQAYAQQPGAIAYAAWWVPQGWRTIVNSPIQRLHFFDITIESDGTLGDRHGWPEQWSDLLEYAEARGLPIEICLTLMSKTAFEHLFSDSKSTQQLLDQSLHLASNRSVAGLHLDVELYEDVDSRALQNYRTFVRTLSTRLSELQPTRTLSVFLPFQSKSHIYDQETLATMHHVVIQGYDAHWLESKVAGPVAPLDGSYALTWRKAVAYADALAIPRERQYMGFPLYGYEWRIRGNAFAHNPTLGKGVITTFAPQPSGVGPSLIDIQSRVAQYGAVFDPVSASSHYRFKAADGQWWEGWFDDWWGLQKKKDFLRQSNQGGIAFFVLGYDNGALIRHYVEARPAVASGSEPKTLGSTAPHQR